MLSWVEHEKKFYNRGTRVYRSIFSAARSDSVNGPSMWKRLRPYADSKGLDQPWPEVIKLFFMLNSTEHEICPANKHQIANNC